MQTTALQKPYNLQSEHILGHYFVHALIMLFAPSMVGMDGQISEHGCLKNFDMPGLELCYTT